MNKAQSISIFGLVLLFQFSLRAESNIIINEIHYDVSDKTLRAEFIELHNASDKLVDISGWRISSAVNYIFPQNTILESGDFLVIAEDPKTIVDRVNALGFSPDGKLLATGGGVPSRSGELKVWNVSTGELVSSNVDSHSDTISGLVFSPSGQFIATSATDRFVKVFKVNGGDLEKSFEGHTNHVLDVTWSADGFLLASAGADNVVKIWDYEKGTQKETVKGHSKAVGSIDYLGLTGTLLSSSGDKSVRLSNKPLPDSDTFIHVSGASHDGSHIAAGGEDSVLRI